MNLTRSYTILYTGIDPGNVFVNHLSCPSERSTEDVIGYYSTTIWQPGNSEKKATFSLRLFLSPVLKEQWGPVPSLMAGPELLVSGASESHFNSVSVSAFAR